LSYEFVYTRRAETDIQKLDYITKKRIGKTLLRYGEDPFKYAERLIDSRLGDYRFKIGDYRVIFDMEGEKIIVLRVGHRKQIYKR
jgi:mRNA interferase RelE/StbE